MRQEEGRVNRRLLPDLPLWMWLVIAAVSVLLLRVMALVWVWALRLDLVEMAVDASHWTVLGRKGDWGVRKTGSGFPAINNHRHLASRIHDAMRSEERRPKHLRKDPWRRCVVQRHLLGRL
jgi:hypothetical protein